MTKSIKLNKEIDFEGKKVLFFNLKSIPFEVMVTGEKNVEYRNIGTWMNSRLFDKDGTPRKYDFVKFVIGMNSKNPYFICEYKGFKKVKQIHKKYSNGLEVNFVDEKWGIILGKIIKTGNIKAIKKQHRRPSNNLIK